MFRKTARLLFSGRLQLVVFSTIVGLILAEGVARLFIPGWAPRESERVNFWRYDKMLGWAHEPGQKGKMFHQDFTIQIEINSQGYRDDEYPFARTNKKRMLVIGDSFAWGFGVEKHQRFSEILEQRFPDWEIINMAVSGYSTDQELLLLQSEISKYRPDSVFLLLHRNDFWGNAVESAYSYNKPWFELRADDSLILRNQPVPDVGLHEKFQRYLVGKTWFLGRAYSMVANWMSMLSNALLAIADQVTQQFGLNIVSTPSMSKESSQDHTEEYSHRVTCRLLENILQLADQHGAQFYFAGVSLTDIQSAMMLRLSQDKQIAFLDMNTAFRAAGDGTRFPHDFHWNERGHKLAADLLEPFLFQTSLR